MTILISRDELLDHLRKEREDYFREHFSQDPATGAWKAINGREEYLSELDDRITFIEFFPAFHVSPVAKVINDNQPGRTAIIEILTDPPTLGVGTLLFASRLVEHR